VNRVSESDLNDPRPAKVRPKYSWVVFAGLVHRTASLPVAITLGKDSLGQNTEIAFKIGMIVALVNVILTVGLVRGRVESLLTSTAFFWGDVGAVVALNFWSTQLVSDGDFLVQGADVFHLYTLGTVVVWTSVRGYRAAALLIAFVLTCELAVVLPSHAAITTSELLQIIARIGWLAAGMAVPLVIMMFARRATNVANERSLVAGRAVERALALRSIHDTILQTFGQIVRRTTSAHEPESRLCDVKELASRQASQIQAALLHDNDSSRSTLTDGLNGLAAEYGSDSLAVQLKMLGGESLLPLATVRALIGATREALTNILKHARAHEASVTVLFDAQAVSVQIVDHGVGFDTSAVAGGYGISHSIRRRLEDVGGHASIHSRLGEGTQVDLIVPRSPEETWVGDDIKPTTSISMSSHEVTSAEDIASHALTWFAIPAMAYRVCISPLQVIAAIALLKLYSSVPFVVALIAVLVADVIILVGLLAGRFHSLLQSNVYFAVDIAVAAGLNVWSAVELPTGRVLDSGLQIFWGYAIGVLAFWTGLRGLKVGIAMVVAGAVLQVAMIEVNHASHLPSGWMNALAQMGLLVMAVLVVWLLTVLARQAARTAVAEGLRAGRALERTRELRTLYLGALSVLDRICQLAMLGTQARPVHTLTEIRGLALTQSDHLRRTVKAHARSPQGLSETLNDVRAQFRRKGLRVELVAAELTSEPESAVVEALAEALVEALENVRRHAGVVHVVVSAADMPERSAQRGIEVIVRDQGRGFDLDSVGRREGLARIESLLKRLGGSAEIWSSPGAGTRVRLRTC